MSGSDRCHFCLNVLKNENFLLSTLYVLTLGLEWGHGTSELPQPTWKKKAVAFHSDRESICKG